MGLLGSGSGTLGANNPGTASYSWVDNGTGGVNYYIDRGGLKTPTTREDFAAGTGQDVGSIENWVASNYAANNAPASDPTATNTLSSPTSPSGGGTASPDYSQQIGQYNNELNNLLPAQQNAGNQNIENSYQSALQQLLQGKNIADRNYGTAKQQSATGYVGAKNTIGSQAGSALNGLLRLLGSRGAGLSSAADAARQAVARGAGLQRGDVGNTFAQNNQSLDTGYGDFNNQYNQQVSSAGTQRDNGRQTLQNNIESSRAGLLQAIAGLQSSPTNAQPYLDQANAIQQGIAGYVPKQISYNTPAYQAPSLASYTTAPQATPQYSNNAGASDYFSPYLQTLLGKKQLTATG